MQPKKEHEDFKKVTSVNQELIEFDKKCGSSNVLLHLSLEAKAPSETNNLQKNNVTSPLSMSLRKNPDANFLIGNLPDELTLPYSRCLPNFDSCFDPKCNASPQEENKNSPKETAIKPIYSKIQRRDASDNLSPYFR